MPEGISVIVDDEGFANITFENPLLRGPALDKLIKIGGAETVDKTTENGYPTYRVPEGNARAAGLLQSRRPAVVDVEPDITGVPAEVVHVAADGTETPLVPDADGLVTLVSGGSDTGTAPVEPQVDPNQPAPQGNSDEPPSDPEATPADNGGQTEPAPKDAPRYPAGEPSDEWSLPELKAYAVDKGLDPHELRSKVKVLALINGK